MEAGRWQEDRVVAIPTFLEVIQEYRKIVAAHLMDKALESIACCLAIENGVIPPTINFETPDPDCDIDCVPNTPRKSDLKVVLNNSYAFGGNNCCVAFAKV